MKLLLTSDWFTPAVNGVVTSVLNLRNGLEDRGHDSYPDPVPFYMPLCTGQSIYITCAPWVWERYIPKRGWGPCKKAVEESVDLRPDIVRSNCEFSISPAAGGSGTKLGSHLSEGILIFQGENNYQSEEVIS